MHNQLTKVFNYNEHQVRTVINEQGEPMFCGKDVCHILEIKNTSQAFKTLKEGQKGIYLTYTLGGDQDLIYVSESGLYKLIMRSRKKEAVAFQDWIFEEVLPKIRKTGSYNAEPPKQLSQIEILLQSAQVLAEQEKQIKQLATSQNQLNDKVKLLEDKITKDQVNNDLYLQDVEKSDMLIPEISTRNKITRLVRAYTGKKYEYVTAEAYKQSWNRLYSDILYVSNINLKARAKSQNKKPMDIAQELNMLPEVFAIATKLFGDVL